MQKIIFVVGTAVLALIVGAGELAFIARSEQGFADNTEAVAPNCLSGRKCF
jgi:hypothetical protein